MADTLPTLHVIGLMSGTSLDGIDAACVRIQLQAEPMQLLDWEIIGTHSEPFSATLQQQLLQTVQAQSVSWQAVAELNQQLGQQFAHCANTLIKACKAQSITVDCIASHGLTVYHQPPLPHHSGYTLQLGDAAGLAIATQKPVIADFRSGDMALGGQGAPLVPFADWLLFQEKAAPCLVQNIGGIGNVTAIPQAAIGDTSGVMAFDTGPGNMLIDAMAQHFYQQPYDANGHFARQGQVHVDLLNQLLAEPYYQQAPPKSTGRERYGKHYVQQLLAEHSLSAADWLATLTALTAESIVQAYQRYILPQIHAKMVIIGGGGARNETLMTLLKTRLAPLGIRLSTHEDWGIDSTDKEALAFALLGYARYCKLPNTLPHCTGAQQAISSGGLWYPA